MPLIDQGLTLQLDVVANDKSTTGFFSKFKQQTKEMVNVWNQSWKEMGQTVNNEVKEIKVQVRSMGTVTKNEVRNIMKTSSASFKSVKNNASSAFVDIRKEARTTSTTINAEMGKAKRSGNDAFNSIGRSATKSGKTTRKDLALTQLALSGMLQAVRQVGHGISKMGKGIRGGIGESIGTFAPFEASMDELQILSEASDKSMANIEKKFFDIGRASKFTTQEMAEFAITLKRGGVELNTIGEQLQNFDDFANANRISLKKSGSIIKESLANFNVGFDQTQKIMDSFTATANASNTSAVELARAFKGVAGKADDLNIPMDQLNKALAVLANRGIKGNEGAVQLRNLFRQLSQDSGEVSEVLKEMDFNLRAVLKSTGGDVVEAFKILQSKMEGYSEAQRDSIINTIGQRTAQKGLLALFNSTAAELDKVTDSQAKQAGMTQRQSKAMKDNLETALISLESSMENLTNTLGKSFSPFIRFASEQIQNLVDALTLMPKPIKDIIAVAAILGAGFFSLAGFLTTAAASVGVIIIALDSLAIALGTTLIPMLIAAGEGFALFVAGAVFDIGVFMLAAAPFIAFGAAVFAAWKTNFAGIRDILSDFQTFWNNWQSPFSKDIKGINKDLNETKITFQDFFEGIENGFKAVFEFVARIARALGALSHFDFSSWSAFRKSSAEAMKNATDELMGRGVQDQIDEQIQLNEDLILSDKKRLQQLKKLVKAGMSFEDALRKVNGEKKKSTKQSKDNTDQNKKETVSLKLLGEQIKALRKGIAEETDAAKRKEKVDLLKKLEDEKEAIEVAAGLKEESDTKEAKRQKKLLKEQERAEIKAINAVLEAYKNGESDKIDALLNTREVALKNAGIDSTPQSLRDQSGNLTSNINKAGTQDCVTGNLSEINQQLSSGVTQSKNLNKSFNYSSGITHDIKENIDDINSGIQDSKEWIDKIVVSSEKEQDLMLDKLDVSDEFNKSLEKRKDLSGIVLDKNLVKNLKKDIDSLIEEPEIIAYRTQINKLTDQQLEAEIKILAIRGKLTKEEEANLGALSKTEKTNEKRQKTQKDGLSIAQRSNEIMDEMNRRYDEQQSKKKKLNKLEESSVENKEAVVKYEKQISSLNNEALSSEYKKLQIIKDVNVAHGKGLQIKKDSLSVSEKSVAIIKEQERRSAKEIIKRTSKSGGDWGSPNNPFLPKRSTYRSKSQSGGSSGGSWGGTYNPFLPPVYKKKAKDFGYSPKMGRLSAGLGFGFGTKQSSELSTTGLGAMGAVGMGSMGQTSSKQMIMGIAKTEAGKKHLAEKLEKIDRGLNKKRERADKRLFKKREREEKKANKKREKEAKDLADKKLEIQKKLKEEIKAVEESLAADIADITESTLEYKLGVIDKTLKENIKSTKENVLSEKLAAAQIKRLTLDVFKERLKMLEALETEFESKGKSSAEMELIGLEKQLKTIQKEAKIFSTEMDKALTKPESKKDESSNRSPILPGGTEANAEIAEALKSYNDIKDLNGEIVDVKEEEAKLSSILKEDLKSTNKLEQDKVYLMDKVLEVDTALIDMTQQKIELKKQEISFLKEVDTINNRQLVLDEMKLDIDRKLEKNEINRLQATDERLAIAKQEAADLKIQLDWAARMIKPVSELLEIKNQIAEKNREIADLEEITFENLKKQSQQDFIKGDIDASQLLADNLKNTADEIQRLQNLPFPSRTLESQQEINRLIGQQQELSVVTALSQGEFNREMFSSVGLSDEMATSFTFSANRIGEMVSKIPGLKEALSGVLDTVMGLGEGIARIAAKDVVGGTVQILTTLVEAGMKAYETLSDYASGLMKARREKLLSEIRADIEAIESEMARASADMDLLKGYITEDEHLKIILDLDLGNLDNDVENAKKDIKEKFLTGFTDETLLFQPDLKMDEKTIEDMISKIEAGEEFTLTGGTEVQREKAEKAIAELKKTINARKTAEIKGDHEISQSKEKAEKERLDKRKEEAQELADFRDSLEEKDKERTKARSSQYQGLVKDEEDLRIELIDNANDKEEANIERRHKQEIDNIYLRFDSYKEGWEKQELMDRARDVANKRRQNALDKLAKKRKDNDAKQFDDEKKALLDRANLLKSIQDEQFKADKLRHDKEINRLEKLLVPLKREREDLQNEIKELENQKKVDLADIDKGALEEFKKLVSEFTISDQIKSDALNRFGFNISAGDLPTTTAEMDTLKEAMEEFFATRKQEIDAQKDIEEISPEEYDAQLRELHLVRGKFYDRIRKGESFKLIDKQAVQEDIEELRKQQAILPKGSNEFKKIQNKINNLLGKGSKNYKTQLDGLMKFRDAFIDFETKKKSDIEDNFKDEMERIDESLVANDNKQQKILTDIQAEKRAIEDLELAYRDRLNQIKTQINNINKAHVDWESNIRGVASTFKKQMTNMIADVNKFKLAMNSAMSMNPVSGDNITLDDFAWAEQQQSSTTPSLSVRNNGSGSYMTHDVLKDGNLVATFGSVRDKNDAIDPISKSMSNGELRWFDGYVKNQQYFSQLSSLPGFSKGGIKGDDGMAFIRKDEIIIPPDLSRFIQDSFKVYNSPAAANNKTMTNEINLGGIHLNSPVVKSEADVMKIMEYMMQEVMPEFSRQLSDKIGNVISPEF